MKLCRFLLLPAILLAVVPACAQQTPDAASQELLTKAQNLLAGGKYQEAIAAFKDANKRRQNCDECYLGLGRAYLKLGDFDSALRAADKAMSLATTPAVSGVVHNLKGHVLSASGPRDPKKLKLAEAEYRSALQQDPQDAVLHLNLGVALLRQLRDEEGSQEIKTFLAMSPNAPEAEMAKRLLANPRRARETYAPEFSVITVQGETLSLSQLAGKFIVLDFWATWCPVCVQSVGEMRDLVKKYPRERLVVISISSDKDDQKWREFIDKKRMDWPQARDLRVCDLFNVNGFPTYIVIDGEGIIQKRISGTDPNQSVAYQVKEALANMPQLKK